MPHDQTAYRLLQIKQNYGIYRCRVSEIAYSANYLEVGAVPNELRISQKTYTDVQVAARMLSVYDGLKHLLRNEADYTAMMLKLLPEQEEG